MTRIKLTIATALTSAMILGSTIVFASAPAADQADADSSISATTDTTEMLKPKPGGRRGGAGFFLLK